MAVTAAFMEESLKLSRAQQAELVDSFLRGDKRAFDKLFGASRPRLKGLCLRMGVQEQDAEDLVQNVAIKCFKYLPKFDGASAFHSWAHTITVNEVKTYYINGNRKKDSTLSMDASTELSAYVEHEYLREEADAPELISAQQAEAIIMRAIEDLSDDLRETLVLREFDGLSYDEIAARTGAVTGTVRSRLFRAREQVDNKLKEMGEPRRNVVKAADVKIDIKKAVPAPPAEAKAKAPEKIPPVLDEQKRDLVLDGAKRFSLSNTEYMFLKVLFSHPDEPMQARKIARLTKKLGEPCSEKMIWLAKDRLLKKLEEEGVHDFLLSKRRVGMRIPALETGRAKVKSIGYLSFNARTKELHSDEATIRLTKGGYEMIKTLFNHPCEPLTVEELMEKAGGKLTDCIIRSEAIRINKRLEAKGGKPAIANMPHHGFYLPPAKDLPHRTQRIGEFILDCTTRELQKDKACISLSKGEYNLLKVMADHPGEAVGTAFLLQTYAGKGNEVTRDSIQCLVGKINQKLVESNIDASLYFDRKTERYVLEKKFKSPPVAIPAVAPCSEMPRLPLPETALAMHWRRKDFVFKPEPFKPFQKVVLELFWPDIDEPDPVF